MEDLKELEQRGKAVTEPMGYLSEWSLIVNPLNVEEWRRCLECHPDEEFFACIINGISESFRIGFEHHCLCRGATANILSAQKNPEAVEEYVSGKAAGVDNRASGCSGSLEAPHQ